MENKKDYGYTTIVSTKETRRLVLEYAKKHNMKFYGALQKLVEKGLKEEDK